MSHRLERVRRVMRNKLGTPRVGDRMRRSEMKPGTMFVTNHNDLVWPKREVWVVLDSKREVGFWTGALTSIGHFAPAIPFEVI